MAVPDLVRERLGGEKPVTHVPLGGEDELWVTPTRGLVYRGEGLLSGETVEEYPLDAQTLAVTEGRRKTTIRLDRGYDGTDEFTVPAKHTDDALRPVVEGVLAAAGVTEDGEAVEQVYRLGELTLVVTDGRVVKHVGSSLWTAEDYEEFPYDRVTDLDLEQGNVSSELVIEVDGRPQRIKTPSEDAHDIRQTVEAPLLATHEVDSVDALRAKFADDDAAVDDDPDDGSASAEPTGDDGGLGSLLEFGDLDDAREELSGGRPSVDDRSGRSTDDLAAEVAALREAVEAQGERIEELQELFERLIEELRRAG
ncbi:MAG: hypothetical protein ABEJ92_04620 [Halobacteriales archaeon]